MITARKNMNLGTKRVALMNRADVIATVPGQDGDELGECARHLTKCECDRVAAIDESLTARSPRVVVDLGHVQRESREFGCAAHDIAADDSDVRSGLERRLAVGLG